MVKRGPDDGGDQVVKEQEEPCSCDCDGGAGGSTAIKTNRYANVDIGGWLVS